ncbi:DUF2794 domain-containing protein [Sandarakinorhabdus sp.]|uniref:DUF2794 domain-containing protein n=1 Tax=Sandarakinorhabdus sp. TaxID=1916663 RepID=UPI00286EB079|nr:DUF2794 domain-containing protein [Sandarakinorhabdus sp.]
MNNVTPLPASPPAQVTFTRQELDRIMSIYGRMVAAGTWRDYALAFGARQACFSAFRRAAEHPEVQIIKDPALRLRQGEWLLLGEGGAILKRGHELAGVLAVLERRLVKLVEA